MCLKITRLHTHISHPFRIRIEISDPLIIVMSMLIWKKKSDTDYNEKKSKAKELVIAPH